MGKFTSETDHVLEVPLSYLRVSVSLKCFPVKSITSECYYVEFYLPERCHEGY